MRMLSTQICFLIPKAMLNDTSPIVQTEKTIMTIRINYIQKLSLYTFTLLLFFLSGNAQDPCLIRTATEPDIISRSFQAVQSVNSALNDVVSWQNPEWATGIDGLVSTIDLAPGESSDRLVFNDFYFDIPLGARITGLQLELTGASTLSEALDEKMVQFLLDGSPIGNNLADKSVISSPWQENLHTWNYGYEFSDWGIDPTYEMLNNNVLEFGIQLENDSDTDSLHVAIENVSFIVYYEPLYSICGHECVVLYNDEVADAVNYIWELPEGVKLQETDENERVVNVDFSMGEYGILEVGLTITTPSDTFYCNRQFLKEDCGPASIGDFVWYDENGNGVQDPDEPGLENIQLNLFNPYEELLHTVSTDVNGKYSFTDLDPGYYFVELVTSEFLVTSNQNTDSLNSDFNSDFATDIFYVSGGDSILTIDAGLVTASSISGSIWRECDGDGIFDGSDIFANGVTVALFQNDVFIQEVSTDFQGEYVFENLSSGMYTLAIQNLSDIAPLSGDNVFDQNKKTEVDLGIGEDKEQVDGALLRYSGYEFSIFLDTNFDGVFTEDEDELEGLEVILTNESSTFSSFIENGKVIFDELLVGTYTLILPNLSQFDVAASQFSFMEVGSDIEFSLGSLMCGSVIPSTIILSEYHSEIGDFVWFDDNGNGIQDDNEKGIPDITVQLIHMTTADVVEETVTDANGFYQFLNIPEASYLIYILLPDETLQETILNADDKKGSKVVSIGGTYAMGPVNITNGYKDNTWDAGFKLAQSSISGFTFLDLDGDNVLSGVEELLEGVDVYLYTSSIQLVDESVTDENGFYTFDVDPGAYYIGFSHPLFFEVVEIGVGTNSLLDSDVLTTGDNETSVFSVLPGEQVEGINIGYILPPSIVGNLVFMDFNENGVFDADEEGIEDVSVKAYNENGEVIEETFTTSGGLYQLSLYPGTYYLEFKKDGILQETIHIPSILDNNSDITNAYGPFTTDAFSVSPGENIMHKDAGFLVEQSIIGDLVWYDINGDGNQDFNELGVKDMMVHLHKVGTGIVQSTTTGNGIDTFPGVYHFKVYEPGEYFVQYELENNGVNFTQYEPQGNGPTTDNGFATTPSFSVEMGQAYHGIDGGIVTVQAVLGDFVWADSNENGIQDNGEKGINGINVFLYDDAFNFIDVTLTSYNVLNQKDGFYHFDQLESGNYILVFDTEETFSVSNAGFDESADSDVTNEFLPGSTGIIQLMEGELAFNIDAGLKTEPLSSVGDYVWLDEDKDGIQDPGENGVENIELHLVDAENNLMQVTTSDINGYYVFKNIEKGYYKIFVPSLSTLDFTEHSIGGEELDSDIQSTGESFLFYIESGDDIKYIDVGLIDSDGFKDEVKQNLESANEENEEEDELVYGTKIKDQELDEDAEDFEKDQKEIDKVQEEFPSEALQNMLTLYPVPAHQDIHLKINRAFTKDVKIELLNLHGEILLSRITPHAKGTVHTFQLDHLVSGMYIIKVTDGQSILFKKFVID